MLELIGGELYQWDKCRKIAIDDPEGKITEIHYARDCDNACIVVTVKTDESGAKYAEIPNILLQSFCPVYAYAVNVQNEESTTIAVSTFIVREKGKPADYIYTETEVLCYKELDKRIKKLEEGGGSGKTAYEYAKDGGYTGTEEEFAEKLAKETVPFVITLTADESGNYTSDKTGEEILTAFDEGRQLVCNIDRFHSVPLSRYASLVYKDFIFYTANGSQYKNIIIRLSGKSINRIFVTDGEYSEENTGVLNINGQLYNGSADVTVDTRDFVFNVNLIDEESGECEIDVTAEAFATTYATGRTMVCNFLGFRLNLVAIEEADGVLNFCYMALLYGGQAVQCIVTLANNTLSASGFILLVPITINGETWDGSEPKDFTDTINSMIDNKLGVIENGSY